METFYLIEFNSRSTFNARLVLIGFWTQPWCLIQNGKIRIEGPQCIISFCSRRVGAPQNKMCNRSFLHERVDCRSLQSGSCILGPGDLCKQRRYSFVILTTPALISHVKIHLKPKWEQYKSKPSTQAAFSLSPLQAFSESDWVWFGSRNW